MWYIESAMASIVHGFRQLSVHKCESTGQPVLVGGMGAHQHQVLSVPAVCDGPQYAVWMSDEARTRMVNKTTHAEPPPVFDCTCAYYVHRTYQGAYVDPAAIAFYGMMMIGGYVLYPPLIVHITALGQAVIYTEGARVQRYVIDYFVRPEHAVLPLTNLIDPLGLISKGYPRDCQEKVTDIKEDLYSSLDASPEDYHEIQLEYFGKLFNRPVLQHNSLEGCPHCLVASELRKESELGVNQIRDWDRREIADV